MDNSQGYLFIALGRYYIDQVVNTVKSIRIQGDNRPCSIISLNDDVEYCSDMNIFDQVIRFKTDPQVFAQCKTPFEKFGLYPKITMNHYPVYQETMVVDCDMLCIYDTAPLWKFASSYRHDIIIVGLKQDPSWHWGRWASICEYNKLNMPHVSTGFVYMRRGSPTVEKMFRHTVEAFMYYDKLRFIPAYKGGRVEEPCFAYGAARANVPVVEFTEYPIMTFDLLKTDKLPSKLQKFNGQCIELNDYIPFVHMFEKKEGENYKAILAWIMSLQNKTGAAGMNG